METKMHRYMQRIEKIISTPTKSPIRPTKSPLKCRTNQLDQYLKYQLSAKIITSFIKRHHDQLVNLFFNLIQRSQCRQKERIFKFVAIQKKDIKVDFGISAKIMVSVLKQIYRNRYTTFTHNIQLCSNQDRQSFFKKRQDTMKSAVLLRTSSRPEKQNYKEISQFNYDGSSSVGKEPNLKKYEELKAFTAKTIIKLLITKIKSLKGQALSKIQQYAITIRERALLDIKSTQKQPKHKQNDSWADKEILYLQQIDNLRQALNKEKEHFEASKMAQININNQKYFQSIRVIRQFCTHWYQIHKSNLLNGIRSLSHHNRIKAKIRNTQLLSLLKGKAMREISIIESNSLRRAFSCLKDSYVSAKQRTIKREESILYLYLVLSRKIVSNYHMVFRQVAMQGKEIIQRSQNLGQRSQNLGQTYIKQLRTSSVPDLYDINSSKKHLFETEETYNPLIKLNFYSFMDKIFKLILIISKMLIPLKEAFVKIDLYASYSYRIEECFRPLYQNRLRLALDAIKARKPLLVSNLQGELRIAAVLERVIREKYIEVFSCLKILWKEKDLKIKIFPVRQSIIESTKYFLEERNIYTLYSMDYWEKVKQNQFNEPGNPEKEYFPKKRSNTTF